MGASLRTPETGSGWAIIRGYPVAKIGIPAHHANRNNDLARLILRWIVHFRLSDQRGLAVLDDHVDNAVIHTSIHF